MLWSRFSVRKRRKLSSGRASTLVLTSTDFFDDQVLQTKFLNDRGVVSVTGQSLIFFHLFHTHSFS